MVRARNLAFKWSLEILCLYIWIICVILLDPYPPNCSHCTRKQLITHSKSSSQPTPRENCFRMFRNGLNEQGTRESWLTQVKDTMRSDHLPPGQFSLMNTFFFLEGTCTQMMSCIIFGKCASFLFITSIVWSTAGWWGQTRVSQYFWLNTSILIL